MTSSIDLEQVELFPREFQEMEQVQVHRADGTWDPATVICRAKHAKDSYLVRSLRGQIYGAHWANIRSIER